MIHLPQTAETITQRHPWEGKDANHPEYEYQKYKHSPYCVSRLSISEALVYVVIGRARIASSSPRSFWLL